MVLNTLDLGQSQRLRLNTLVRLRWLAIVGQSVTVVIVAYGLGFPLPVVPCFALIACSAGLNIYLALQYPSTHRLPPDRGLRHPHLRRAAACRPALHDRRADQPLLAADDGAGRRLGDLAAAPHDGAARRLVVAMATLLAFFHLPLPWYRRRRARHALHLRRRHLGGAVLARSPSPASTPSASPRRRGCSPTRCRRPNSCCSASSISPRSTGWPPRPRTNSARRSRQSRWSPARWSARSVPIPSMPRTSSCCARRASAAAKS